jgi:hypothetical protein
MLAEAVKTCRAYGAKLVIAKLDRAWNAGLKKAKRNEAQCPLG